MERKVKLTAFSDAKELVSAASKCDFDVDIYSNRYVIDAKSYLGVIGLDFTSVLTVRYSGVNEDFEKMLCKYSA